MEREAESGGAKTDVRKRWIALFYLFAQLRDIGELTIAHIVFRTGSKGLYIGLNNFEHIISAPLDRSIPILPNPQPSDIFLTREL